MVMVVRNFVCSECGNSFRSEAPYCPRCDYKSTTPAADLADVEARAKAAKGLAEYIVGLMREGCSAVYVINVATRLIEDRDVSLTAELRAAREEIERWRNGSGLKYFSDLHLAELQAEQARAASLTQEVENWQARCNSERDIGLRLMAALRKYGEHPRDCGLAHGRVCDCELGAALQVQP